MLRVSRVLSGLLGSFLIVYWVGNTIGNAVAGQFHWQTLPYPMAGVLLGILLLVFALLGDRPRVRRTLFHAIAAGLVTAAVGALPALLLLGTVYDGVAPHMITAIIAIPALFVTGAVVGGTVSYARSLSSVPGLPHAE